MANKSTWAWFKGAVGDAVNLFKRDADELAHLADFRKMAAAQGAAVADSPDDNLLTKGLKGYVRKYGQWASQDGGLGSAYVNYSHYMMGGGDRKKFFARQGAMTAAQLGVIGGVAAVTGDDEEE